MHQFFSFFILLLILSLSSFSQSKPTEQQIKTMLCHKWKVSTIESQGEKLPAEEDVYITFRKDGTFIDSQEGGKPSDNKWTYNHKTTTLTTGDVSKKILRITEKELKLSAKMDGQNMILTLKRVD